MHDKKSLVAMTVFVWVVQAVYLVMPIDLVPDLLPILGWADDLAALGATLAFTVYTVAELARDHLSVAGPTVAGIDYDPVPVEQIRKM